MTQAADYVIPERHDGVLRTLLGIEPGPELDIEIKEAYLRMRRLYDKVSFNLGEHALIQIAVECGASADALEQNFLDVIKEHEGKLSLGTDVMVKWRFGKEVLGKYQGTKRDKVLVVLDDDTGQVRNCHPNNVRLAG